jgi:hypothetical protein
MLVAANDATVGEHHFRLDELVRCQPVPPAEDAEAAPSTRPAISTVGHATAAIATPLAASTSSIAPNLAPAPIVSVPSASCELYPRDYCE